VSTFSNTLLALGGLVLLLCVGCSASAGITVTNAPSLGFESPYMGATVRGDLDGERWIGRAEGSYLWAHKIETGDGHAVSGDALGGAKFWAHPKWNLGALAGYRYNKNWTSRWDKSSAQYLAELQLRFHGGNVGATYSRETDTSGWYGYGLRAEANAGKHVRIVTAWEHLLFDDYSSGDHVKLSALWRF